MANSLTFCNQAKKKILTFAMESLHVGSSTIKEFSNDDFCPKDPIPSCELTPLLYSYLLKI